MEIPAEYRLFFSENEAEELVSQFQLSDNDGSGSIDEHEFRALLARLSLSVTDVEAAELVASIDVDGNGLIDFHELVGMVVRIKKGDARFQALKKFVEALDTTPIALLEREAKKFGLQIAYQLLDEKPGTVSTPAVYLMELTISGKWCGPKGQEKLQAVGKSTREAKFKVAEAGVVRLKKLKPGLAYDLGSLPPEWERWLFDNLERGGSAKKLMQMLAEKGFSPSNNITLMQKISTRVSSLRLRSKRSAPKTVYERVGDEIVKAKPGAVKYELHPQWMYWSQQELERGIDGSIVLKELVAQGYEPEKNPLFTQTLLRSLKSRDDHNSNGPTVVPLDRKFSLWKALVDGNLNDVELFIIGGQDPNNTLRDIHANITLAPLHLASKHGHPAIVRFLLQHGAEVDQLDDFRRTALMIAARCGHTEVCELLMRHGASIFMLDNLNNTPLHMAAFSGCSKIIDLILQTHDETLLMFFANLPKQRHVSYRELLQRAYDAVMKSKLRENERRRFHIKWVFDAMEWLYKELFDKEVQTIVPVPLKRFLDDLVARYHGKLVKHDSIDDDEGNSLEDNVHEIALAKTNPADLISLQEMTFYVDKCLRETYRHLPNKQGRTALHVACEENLVCTHELVIQSLVEKHAINPHLIDHSGQSAIQLLLACRGRPGSPKGDVGHEKALMEKRQKRIHDKEIHKEKERITLRRQIWQQEVDRLAETFNTIETLAQAKKVVKQQGDCLKHNISGWNVYEEPLSKNLLYENTKSGFVQRQVPAKVLEDAQIRLGWKEKLVLESHFVEKNFLLPDWEVHRMNGTDLYFFFNRTTTQCQWMKPTEAPLGWQTRRIFQDEEQFAEYEDKASLAVHFSGDPAAVKPDAVRGRRLGKWRECVGFGVIFYIHKETDQISLDKPVEVLQCESFRYAHVLIRERSEEIEELRGGWRCYYDPDTSHTFYYDEFSGECIHDTDASPDFLKEIKKKPPKSRLALTKEELQQRQEEKEWKAALERVRRHEQQVKVQAENAQMAINQEQQQSDELQKAIQRLEMAITSEYLHINGKGLAYIDARYKRELEVFLCAQKDDLLISSDPTRDDPRNEIERSEELEKELDDDEREHAELEDIDEKYALRERRRVSRILFRAMERMRRDWELCRWGCGRWFPRALSLATHEKQECARRLQICRLGCAQVMKKQQWRQIIYEHEAEGNTKCDSRIVYCPQDCGVWIPHLLLDHHMQDLCVKRPIGDLPCRLGCGCVFQGGAHELLTLEQTRIAHEQDDCELRKVECTWPKCNANILAKERNEHRRMHLISSGVMNFLTAEVHKFKVPKDTKLIKIQAWGAGGGSGHLRGHTVGHGGGGAFVEGACKVFPGETLFISIGSGGKGGKHARMVECLDEDAESGEEPTSNDQLPKTQTKKSGVHVETYVGVAKGGYPGGGLGHSGNKDSACGGGGGFTSVYREGAYGIEYLLIAGGGGGGGTCRNGTGGGLRNAKPVKDGDELRIGRSGGDTAGGAAGECDRFNPICKFLATDGGYLQGGNGAEFGGGGGGGFFGGGGGGFAPGIVGGGGGGSSYVNMDLFDPKSVIIEAGGTIKPGGMKENPPQSVRDAYWDLVDGLVGEGGMGSLSGIANGNHGGVRIARLGFFNDMKFHR